MPAGAVLTVPEALAAPQVSERGFLDHFRDVPGVGRDIAVATTGIKLDGTAPRVGAPPPELGAHNAEVWGALGLSTGEIEALREDGAI